ncbi:saccharopine dehydrogenase NADP-binding domain-containing protein [Paenibacillus sp. 7541]|uniref:saccharopine dehydrogenase NADP-binding domain-containing protein n=1 Tax=Paenibacillus sp. 7541 TaxID=2026236 RepID=UPI000BA67D6C|nr:saccharopine dehydrogenase NADP-binding domain-containing protein [Paenibacillus sp. 7541]PAK55040.1 hypothetical protein CHH75_05850 [Paenibacillus sp. 7541]
MTTIMVVGASGALGKLVCGELLRIFNNPIKLIVTDYKTDRGTRLADSFHGDVQFQYLDVNDEDRVERVLRNVDVAVVVLKQKTPYIQKVCIHNKILCIDVTPFYDFVQQVIELHHSAVDHKVGSVVMSGFFPGLSGLMIQKAISDFQEVQEINVALLQNKNAKAGISGVLDMLRIIAQPVVYPNKVVPGFTQKRTMYFLNYNKEQEVRLIEHSEKILIRNRLTASPINYYTSWNGSGFNKLISMLKRMGVIQKIHKINHKWLSKAVQHNPKEREDAYLTVEVKGKDRNRNQERVKTLALSTFSDYHTTAIVTASLAKIALHKDVQGVVCPFEMTDLDELLSVMNCPEISINEVTK